MRELSRVKPGGIEAGGERGGALFHSERFCLENPYVFAKVLPAQVELGRADFEFEHSSSKLELEEDLLGVGEPQGGEWATPVRPVKNESIRVRNRRKCVPWSCSQSSNCE